MNRPPAIDPASGHGRSGTLRGAVKARLGRTPDPICTPTLARAAREGGLRSGGVIATGILDAKLRAEIARAVAVAHPRGQRRVAHTAIRVVIGRPVGGVRHASRRTATSRRPPCSAGMRAAWSSSVAPSPTVAARSPARLAEPTVRWSAATTVVRGVATNHLRPVPDAVVGLPAVAPSSAASRGSGARHAG
ncbi:MAG: hypothetical protein IT458_10435 [Planctomycetes bacterium]|nr:hypothetical protein [Planctomycetota bacterium]